MVKSVIPTGVGMNGVVGDTTCIIDMRQWFH